MNKKSALWQLNLFFVRKTHQNVQRPSENVKNTFLMPMCTNFKMTAITPMPKKSKITCLEDNHLVAPTSNVMKYFMSLVSWWYQQNEEIGHRLQVAGGLHTPVCNGAAGEMVKSFKFLVWIPPTICLGPITFTLWARNYTNDSTSSESDGNSACFQRVLPICTEASQEISYPNVF